MTKEDIIRMARESGYKDLPTVRLAYQGFDVQHFTNLVIAAERHRVLSDERAALAQPYPDMDRGFSNGWDRCAARQVTQPDNIAKLYEELRSIIDGNSESFTHADAVQHLKDNLEPLKWTPEDTAYRPGGLAQPQEVLRVTSDGKFIWHEDADRMIVEGDFSHAPVLPHILKALRKQRPWVGLTDEEIQTEWVLTPQNDKAEGIWFGRRIEAKLKEKNT